MKLVLEMVGGPCCGNTVTFTDKDPKIPEEGAEVFVSELKSDDGFKFSDHYHVFVRQGLKLIHRGERK